MVMVSNVEFYGCLFLVRPRGPEYGGNHRHNGVITDLTDTEGVPYSGAGENTADRGDNSAFALNDGWWGNPGPYNCPSTASPLFLGTWL